MLPRDARRKDDGSNLAAQVMFPFKRVLWSDSIPGA